ncbi:MAG TPA: hypothetical protein VFA58_04705 [Chthoniobacterales bacterium]|nr:hypothetical protein [Chthoniobacterales bacterium]
MKTLSLRLFLALISGVALISYVFAAPGGAPGRPATGPGSSSSSNSGNGPGFSQDNNPGQQGQSASDGTRFNSQDNPGKSGSAFGRDTADGASSNGTPHAADHGEKMIDTGDRTFGQETASEHSADNAKDQTFQASLMDTGLKAGTHGTPGQPPSGTPPGKHLGWEKGKHNPHRSPSPSATASASPSASASASASATATATASGTP